MFALLSYFVKVVVVVLRVVTIAARVLGRATRVRYA